MHTRVSEHTAPDESTLFSSLNTSITQHDDSISCHKVELVANDIQLAGILITRRITQMHQVAVRFIITHVLHLWMPVQNWRAAPLA